MKHNNNTERIKRPLCLRQIVKKSKTTELYSGGTVGRVAENSIANRIAKGLTKRLTGNAVFLRPIKYKLKISGITDLYSFERKQINTMQRNNNDHAFTLVEVLISLFLISLVLSGLFAIFLTGKKTIQEDKNR